MARIVEKLVLPIPEFHRQLRTVAYARVSNGKDAMLHSLSAQVSYYSKLINKNPEWKFCGVYADEAITGTSDSRPNFLKMVAECRLGNIDLIITKSISRFARNTIILLETVRELKSLGIDVYFEEQNIHTMSAEGELVLTILGSYFYEDEIKEQFIKAFSVFFNGKDVICQTVNDFIRTLSDFSSIDNKISTILQEMQYIADLNELNIRNNSITAQNTAEFEKRCSELNKQYMEKKSDYDKLIAQKNSRLNKIKELKQFLNELNKSDLPLTEFNDDLWRNMIEKVTIYQDKKMMFRFLDGTEIEVQ